MPTNPEHLHAALGLMARNMEATAPAIQAAQADAMRLLREAAQNQALVRAEIAAAAAASPALRCALPTTENMALAYPIPEGAMGHPLLAVDGSQVVPSRHDELAFAVINVGSVLIEPGSGNVPRIETSTRLLFGDELYATSGGLLSEGDLALMRDLAERQGILLGASGREGTIALVDGPLELWGAKDVTDASAFERALHEYLQDLRELRRIGCVPAGYVDKPGANLVVHMLELLAQARARSKEPDRTLLRQVSDRWVFGQLLPPSTRSAVFALQSSSTERYGEDLGIHFFYLNVGRSSQPSLARVEIPAWVGREPSLVAGLHRSLLEQSALLGDRPYPYILHRAHETARITPHERDQIKQRILLEMRNCGFEPESMSPKSSAKAR